MCEPHEEAHEKLPFLPREDSKPPGTGRHAKFNSELPLRIATLLAGIIIDVSGGVHVANRYLYFAVTIDRRVSQRRQ